MGVVVVEDTALESALNAAAFWVGERTGRGCAIGELKCYSRKVLCVSSGGDFGAGSTRRSIMDEIVF